MIRDYLHSYLHDLKARLEEIDADQLEMVADILLKARRLGNRIFVIGNGDGVSAASQFASNLGTDGDFALDDNTHDRLHEDLGPGDVLVAITGSVASERTLRAIRTAKKRGGTTIGFLDSYQDHVGTVLDLDITVSSRNPGISEDVHLIFAHLLGQILRRQLDGRREKVAFLDRDGVINQKPPAHQYVTRWEEFQFRPEAIPMLKQLLSQGYRLVVITNQQGVGKKLMSRQDLDEIHAQMCSALSKHGVNIDGIFACTHLESERCACRKPQPGLFYRAMNELDYTVDKQASLFIGDSPSDREAASAFGVRWLDVDET